ncbi:MAG TPA: hypothetical protein VLD18_04270 [Verrucomicrobiae bacterium]|nr:hypothetical protein [Verrucomicrobiae bacterium]
MKTTQVVSGFLLGASLLTPSQQAAAFVLLDDGGVHVINDASWQQEYIEVRNGSTLRIEAGAAIGGGENQSGVVVAHDASTVVLAGGQVGGVGASSGGIYLYGTSQFVLESGVLGGAGTGAGQVVAFEQASVHVLGGLIGGAGMQSGLIGAFDNGHAEIRGGEFHDNGAFSGLVIGFADSLVELFLCEADLPFGPVADSMATVNGTWKDGSAARVTIMREPTANVVLVEDCEEVAVDSDGDGVLDDADACPQSDLRPTVWVFNQDSGVPNLIAGQSVNAAGCSLADLVAIIVESAAAGARNHGEFVSKVGSELRELNHAGWLTERSKAALLSTAARSHQPSGQAKGSSAGPRSSRR